MQIVECYLANLLIEIFYCLAAYLLLFKNDDDDDIVGKHMQEND
jgi:hypothetical protein